MSTWTTPINLIPPAWRTDKIKDKSGNVRLFEEVLKENPNYEVYTDINGKPITPDEIGTNETKLSKSKNLIDKKKETPAQIFLKNFEYSLKDPANPYNATKTLLALQTAIAGGVGDIFGQIVGNKVSNKLFDNPDKPFKLNTDIQLTPRQAMLYGTGLVLGGLTGTYNELTIPSYIKSFNTYRLSKALNKTNPIYIKSQVLDNHNIEIFYHGSPWRFDKFDTSLIGSGEGGSKYMKGVNLWSHNYHNAPKFANIKSKDAPIHLGKSSVINDQEISPTIYTVEGKGLNLFNSLKAKGLNSLTLIELGYHGVRFPNLVIIFPEFVNKLSFINPKSIAEFIRTHPEVKKWTPFSTEYNLEKGFIPEYGSFSPNITKNLPENLSLELIQELLDAERLWYYKNFDLTDNRVPKLFDLAINHTKTGKSIYPNGYDVMYRGYKKNARYNNDIGSNTSSYNHSVFGWVGDNAELGALSYTTTRSNDLSRNNLMRMVDDLKKLYNLNQQYGIQTLVYPKTAKISYHDVKGKNFSNLSSLPEFNWLTWNRNTDLLANIINNNSNFSSMYLKNIFDLGSGAKNIENNWIYSELIYNNRPGQYLKDPYKVIYPDLYNPSTFK